MMKNILYILIGTAFGFVLVESQVVSWFRIQEMFLFDAFHMYGVIGTAIITAGISLQLIKLYYKRQDTKPKEIQPRELNRGTVIGGVIFGLGWAITGACPGPIYSLVGNTAWIYILVLLSAALGVTIYGYTLGRKS